MEDGKEVHNRQELTHWSQEEGVWMKFTWENFQRERSTGALCRFLLALNGKAGGKGRGAVLLSQGGKRKGSVDAFHCGTSTRSVGGGRSF